MSSFRKGQFYTRAEVAERIELPPELRHGGNWDTGYSRWNGEFFIFCNVGIAGTTGHDYPNRWDGKGLLWTGKTGSRMGTPFVEEMLSGALPVHLFWRGEVRTPFTYAGLAAAAEVIDTIPVQVRWTFGSTPAAVQDSSPGDPIWRRGPPPAVGTHTVVREDGPTELYIMTLEGPAQALFPTMGEGLIPVKLGMSNDPIRRLAELNFGFPPVFRRVALAPDANLLLGKEAFVDEGEIRSLKPCGRWMGENSRGRGRAWGLLAFTS